MMELPYHLKTLPPDALDVIRFMGSLEYYTASKDEITDGVGLTERGFGKVIRRLVTKGYAIMDGSQVYRLSDNGQEAAAELAAYDAVVPPTVRAAPQAAFVRRQLVLVAPRTLIAGQPAEIRLGIAAEDAWDAPPAEMLARLSLVNAQPDRPQEAHFHLDAAHQQHIFTATAGLYTAIRLRVEVFRFLGDLGDVGVCGGMYVDVDVTDDAERADTRPTAYEADIRVERVE